MLSKKFKKSSIYADFRVLLWYNRTMKNEAYTEEKLNNLPKEALTILVLQQSESIAILTKNSETIQKQNEQLIKQIENLREQVAILTAQRFGRSSEKNLQIPGQMTLDMETGTAFNEAEFLAEQLTEDEPTVEQVVVRRKRPKGKRAIDLKDIDTNDINHYLSKEELDEKFPKGWHQLEDECYSELKYIPAKFIVNVHHIGVYAGNGENSKIVRADLPKRLLSHSILTPELAATIFNAKYINAIPYNRISEDFAYNDIHISKQVIAGWMIRLVEYYMPQLHERLKAEQFKSPIIHCDESPFKMTGERKDKDGNPSTEKRDKDYMWVYHSPGDDTHNPVYLYEYDNGSRAAVVPENYLRGYKGTLVTDGYQSYHTLADRHQDELKVAGCWVHQRRKFADIIKGASKDSSTYTQAQKIAAEAVERIAAIYHVDNMYKESSPQERLDNRQQSVKPLVDAYFAWIKSIYETADLDCSSKLRTALTYAVNQEKYLRVFLENPLVPLDNNDAERSIKKFCVGKHSWHIIDSVKGAKASAMLYSVAETLKANGLVPYNYFCHYLNVVKDYPIGEVPEEVLESVLPWSESLPDSCRKKTK